MNKRYCDCCGKLIPKKEYDSPKFDSSTFQFNSGDPHVCWGKNYDLCAECTHGVLKFIRKEK